MSKGCLLCCATYQTAYKNLLFKVRLQRISWSWLPYLNYPQNYARKNCQVLLCTNAVKENLEQILIDTGFGSPPQIVSLGTYFLYFHSTFCDFFKASSNVFESPGLCSAYSYSRLMLLRKPFPSVCFGDQEQKCRRVQNSKYGSAAYNPHTRRGRALCKKRVQTN